MASVASSCALSPRPSWRSEHRQSTARHSTTSYRPSGHSVQVCCPVYVLCGHSKCKASDLAHLHVWYAILVKWVWMYSVLLSFAGPPPDFSSGVSSGFPHFELPFEPVPPIMNDSSLSSPAQGEPAFSCWGGCMCVRTRTCVCT